ncbi:DUF1345 domain-containing protein [Nocardia sp. AG03]|uniref:DUF1345 domain-containing protein n=1 Tax=Nocardia sp. AG03 TaxID=3025312 RepID=UPI0024187B9B|nr:DUF1345 domain-containing protein [Nocardia sp. AG03]
MTDSEHAIPAWQRPTEGESRLAATGAILGIIVVQVLLPNEFLPAPAWALPALELGVLLILLIANPSRMDREERWIRGLSLVLAGLISVATALSALRLVHTIVVSQTEQDATTLLGSGALIWATNVIAFSLWYWEFDRGGPAARANGRQPVPDFLFPQMQDPPTTDPDWRPEYLDYLYLSFTNAASFAPADVLPLSRWCKSVMLAQSAISLVIATLVISRAINILH